MGTPRKVVFFWSEWNSEKNRPFGQVNVFHLVGIDGWMDEVNWGRSCFSCVSLGYICWEYHPNQLKPLSQGVFGVAALRAPKKPKWKIVQRILIGHFLGCVFKIIFYGLYHDKPPLNHLSENIFSNFSQPQKKQIQVLVALAVKSGEIPWTSRSIKTQLPVGLAFFFPVWFTLEDFLVQILKARKKRLKTSVFHISTSQDKLGPQTSMNWKHFGILGRLSFSNLTTWRLKQHWEFQLI